MLIEAAAPFIRSGDLRLKLIGDGPEMPFLRDRIQREGVTNGVVLVGWVPHRDVHEHLSKADVLAFPSIREFGGGVVLEAMAVGLVPIVVDYAGPAELVTRETGWLIPIGTREEIIRRLQSVFEELVRNPGEIDRKSPLAQKRVFDLFTWKAKAIQTTDVYKWVLGIREKPTFGMPFGQ